MVDAVTLNRYLNVSDLQRIDHFTHLLEHRCSVAIASVFDAIVQLDDARELLVLSELQW